jgi:hypothetical protein
LLDVEGTAGFVRLYSFDSEIGTQVWHVLKRDGRTVLSHARTRREAEETARKAAAKGAL